MGRENHMTHAAPPYFWICFGEVVVYLAVFFRFFYYLKRAHHSTWVELGSPSLLNNSIANNFKTLGFLWGNKYSNLSDPTVDRFIWIVRGLLVLAPVMWAIGFIFGLFPG